MGEQNLAGVRWPELQKKSASFDFRITFKKLKTDVCNLIDHSLDHYEAAMDKEVPTILPLLHPANHYFQRWKS